MGKSKKKFELPLASVVWDDAYSEDGWMSLEDTRKHESCTHVSVGFLAYESDTHITLVMTSTLGNSPDRMVATRLTIPKSYIISLDEMVGNGRWKSIIKVKREDEDTEATVQLCD